jgi:hypothetical protein
MEEEYGKYFLGCCNEERFLVRDFKKDLCVQKKDEL